MPRALVLEDVTVDVADRALLVVSVPVREAATAAGAPPAALVGADVVEIGAECRSWGPAPGPGPVGELVEELRRAVGLPVVIRTGLPEVARAAVAAGVAGVDVRHRWADPGLMIEAAAAGLVVASSVPDGGDPEDPGPDPIVRAAVGAGLIRGQLVLDTVPDGGADRRPTPGVTGPVLGWSADPSARASPAALAGAALAITTGRRWIRVGTVEGFGAVRDTLAAVEGARPVRTGVKR